MKQGEMYKLQYHNPVAASSEWETVQQHLSNAIASIVYPPGASTFTINATKEGNGVVPIKHAFINGLLLNGDWQLEQRAVPEVGKVDATLTTAIGVFGVEWETGNVSSSHRALNRLALGLYKKTLVGGVLVLPTRALYYYLTDRIGNMREITPYLPLYKLLPLSGVLAIIPVEHDAADPTVEPFKKGTDGLALMKQAREEATRRKLEEKLQRIAEKKKQSSDKRKKTPQEPEEEEEDEEEGEGSESTTPQQESYGSGSTIPQQLRLLK